MAYIIILIILIIFITASSYISYNIGYYNCELKYLRGFWQSPNDFNKEAGIKIFTMYIGEYTNGKYPVYILMIDNDDNILINTPTQMYLSQIFSNTYSMEKHREFVCKFSDLNSEFIPNNIKLNYYSRSGKIILVDNTDNKIGRAHV